MRRSNDVLNRDSPGRVPDLEDMTDQARLRQQLQTLSAYDLGIVMRAMQLHALQVFGGNSSGEEIFEELVEKAQKDPERARTLVAQAQEQQVYAGEPVRSDMDIREAGDVLKRLLFNPDL
jgi:hypothetical protein